MIVAKAISEIRNELTAGMNQNKCRKCGCMRTMLISLDSSLTGERLDAVGLAHEIKDWLEFLEEQEYSDLECEYCYPVSVRQILENEFPGF
ncbi:MAG TPA: hypothetical protein VMW26_02095 [Methanomassiliicoccales archaeon]|nr:hypothetical protein [Methanomassiliicoccales archaeon]